MESLISTFHIDWKIMAAQLVNFGIVIAVLYFFALKPLKKLMSERSQKIEGGIADAKTNAEVLKSTKAEYDKAIAAARAEATNIFNEGKKEAEAKRAEMLEKAMSEVDTMITNGKKTLEAEKTKMVADAKKEIVALVVDATRKLLEGEASSKLEEKASQAVNNI